MNRRTKLLLMFAPMVGFFIGFAVLVGDMRHPQVSSDQCVVTATGTDAGKFKGQGVYIYRQSTNVLNDVSLRCNRMGTVLLNDAQLFLTTIKSGQGAEISRKRYRFLPDRWMVSVRTGVEK